LEVPDESLLFPENFFFNKIREDSAVLQFRINAEGVFYGILWGEGAIAVRC